jgi:lysophospholipid acyltransferase (LPLAT)-like uncharacterized protein
MMRMMRLKEKLRGWAIDCLGKPMIWLWAKSTRTTVLGEDGYRRLRQAGRPVIILVWHGKIFLVPYFFRGRGNMPLISPSRDGEIPARIMNGWGYKILRGSSSHFMKSAWQEMKKELAAGGEVIIVPDGPKGPDRVLKMGCIKLAAETGAVLVPWSFSTSKRKALKSWDRFLLFYPLTRVVAAYGAPVEVGPTASEEEAEEERRRVEKIMIDFDREIDSYFEEKSVR